MLISNDGTPMISGANLVKSESASQLNPWPQTSTRGVKGFLRWYSPEVIRGEDQSKSSDIWGFGMTIYVN